MESQRRTPTRTNLSISVAYVGNVGRQLWRTLNVNAAQPGVGPLLQRRPYFQTFGLDTTIQNGCNCENSSYHGLEAVIAETLLRGIFPKFRFHLVKGDRCPRCSQPRISPERPRIISV